MMGKSTGGAGRLVTARGLRAGDVVRPQSSGGFLSSPMVISRVVRGVAYGRGLNAREGSMAAQEQTIGNRSTRFGKYEGR